MDRDFYSVSLTVDPVGPTSGTRRARRGADRKFKRRFRTAWLGDGLVPVSSATAPQGQQVTVRHVGGTMHHRLQTHAAVYEVIREQLCG